MASSPAAYNAWYDTTRGAWIAQREFQLMMSMMQPEPGASLLDIGCGTGHFSRLFAARKLEVTGIDPDSASIDFAKSHSAKETYVKGDARQLPYNNNSFDYCSAVTSLCFVSEPEQALLEMWRISRKGVMLGLLNRDSLLYRERNSHPGYATARWDDTKGALNWINKLSIEPKDVLIRSAIFFPKGNCFSRAMEKLTPSWFRYGAFLAIYLKKL